MGSKILPKYILTNDYKHIIIYSRGESMKYKIIFKKDIALKLRDMGNPIMDADVNLKHPKFVIYYFEDTDKLQHDLGIIQNS